MTAGFGNRIMPRIDVLMAVQKAPNATFPKKSRRVSPGVRCFSCFMPFFLKQEPLHRHRPGGTTFGTESASDALRLVLDDGGGGLGRSFKITILEGLKIIPSGEFRDRDNFEAIFRTDIDTPAAEDELFAIEDRIDAAVEATG